MTSHTRLPGIVENIVRSAEQGDAAGIAEAELASWASSFLNSPRILKIEQAAREQEEMMLKPPLRETLSERLRQ